MSEYVKVESPTCRIWSVGVFVGWDKLLFGDGTLRVASGKGHIVWHWSFGLVCWLADFMVTYVSQIA
jgi:hypothetical protein